MSCIGQFLSTTHKKSVIKAVVSANQFTQSIVNQQASQIHKIKCKTKREIKTFLFFSDYCVSQFKTICCQFHFLQICCPCCMPHVKLSDYGPRPQRINVVRSNTGNSGSNLIRTSNSHLKQSHPGITTDIISTLNLQDSN